MHYFYIKKQPQTQAIVFSPRLISLMMIVTGLTLIGSAAIPLVFYQFFVSPRFSAMVKPIAQETVLGEESQYKVDLTKVSNWFPEAPKLPLLPSKITHYNISIPKLKIKEATVEIGGEDLGKAMIQYPGTAFPGQYGNTVVFCHSVLPQFFNPQNYLTICSTLPNLKINDEIIVDFDGVRYRFQVEQMVEVEPDDISVLEQRYDNSYLTMVTCVPPGTDLRRLVVRAKIKLV